MGFCLFHLLLYSFQTSSLHPALLTSALSSLPNRYCFSLISVNIVKLKVNNIFITMRFQIWIIEELYFQWTCCLWSTHRLHAHLSVHPVHSYHDPVKEAGNSHREAGTFTAVWMEKSTKTSNSMSLLYNILVSCLVETKPFLELHNSFSSQCLARTWIYFFLMRRSHFEIVIWTYSNTLSLNLIRFIF